MLYIPVDKMVCDHQKPITEDCQACDREYREELLRYWASQSDLFDRSKLPSGVPVEC